MRYHNANIRQAQQRFIRSQRTETDCLTAFNLLTDDLLFDELEKLLPEHRERLFPPTETLAMFLAQAMSADRSCQNTVNQAAIHRLLSGLPQCSTHTGGYCRARQRLPLELIHGLTRYLGEQIDQQLPEAQVRGVRSLICDQVFYAYYSSQSYLLNGSFGSIGSIHRDLISCT